MEPERWGWWRRHGLVLALLVSAAGIAFLVRTVFMAQIIEAWGPLNVYGGGSDSFYHSRVMEYIVLNHHNLVRDSSLNFPLGAVNPREPLFDWMNALLGLLFAPVFGGNPTVAGAWFLDAGGPIWAALGVFPIYLLGREASSSRVGIVAAFLYPLMVANIDSSTFGYANYLAFYTFFILVAIYSLLRTVKAVGSHRWVTSYREPKAILAGLRGFLRTERTAVKWAVFTGVAFGTLALAWQGYTFFVAVVVVFLVFAIIVERIRKIDSFGLYIALWIIGLVGFPMAMPYYLPQGLFVGWFDIPVILYFGALLLITPFLFLRESPWVVSLPILVGIGAAGLAVLYVVQKAAFLNIVTGQGYFVKTLVYSTVAEAQAPSIDQLIVGYGIATFFLAFVGLVLYVWGAVRARFRRVQMVFLVFAVISVYLPISAAKFFFLGSAAFALLAAEAIVRLLDIGGYATLRRNIVALSDRRNRLAAFRRSFKARQVLVMLLVIGLILPVIWLAVDAGVPYNLKSGYNQQIYNTLPAPLRSTAPSSSTNFYLGAAGTQLDTPDQYDENGYNWLALQDQNVPQPERPAFVSWWDYGFQAIAQGNHPSVADNFQNGIDPAGNFLLAQNESQAIAALATRLLTAEQVVSGNPYLPADLNAILTRDGINVTTLHNLIVNTSSDIPLVLGHPDRYLPVSSTNLDATNAMYLATEYFLATSLPTDRVAEVYNDIGSYTGWTIRYAMVDSRLFPTSGQSTGIFYAPADLTDRVITSGGVPSTFFNVTITGSDGNTYPLGSAPAGILATNYNIQYYPPFYNSMIYRVFAGYNGTDVGQGNGIPGLQSFAGNTVANDPPEPGWMLSHFQVVYQTGYYCPFADPATHPGCFHAMNAIDAQHLAKAQNGTANLDPSIYYGVQGGGGESILEYYAGQPMTGTVTLPNGQPVVGAHVTVDDAWGIPHMSTLTGSDGAYSVILPPGNDTVNVTTGTFNALDQDGSTSLLALKVNVPYALGSNPSAPTLVHPMVLAPASVQGFVYWNQANNSSYIPTTDAIVPGASVVLWGGGGPARTATTDASGAFVVGNLPPGVYNMAIVDHGSNFTEAQVILGAGATHNATTGLSPGSVTGKVFIPTGGFGATGATVTVRGANGAVSSATTNTTGAYKIDNLGPGNYSVVATLAGQGLGSNPRSLAVATAGSSTVLNFTLVPTTTVTLVVLADGVPVSGMPVRFDPIGPFVPPSTGNGTNGTGPSPTPPSAPGTGPAVASTNATLVVSDSDGVVTATVPYGNYSVYAFGLVGSTWRAAFETAYLPAGRTALELAPIPLAPAIRLSGTIPLPGATATTVVRAYDARGDSVATGVNGTGGWNLYLPAGTYSLLATQAAPSGSSAPALAGAMNVTLSYPTTVAFALSPALSVVAAVGEPTTTNGPGFFPAANAVVHLRLTTGWQVAALSAADGNVSFVAPTSIPTGTSYCLSAAAFGFEPYDTCGFSSTTLADTTTIPLTLTPVPVNLTVHGLPSGASITVNFTATSGSAVTRSVTGGPTFALDLAPGNYELTAWAPAPTPPGLLLPTAPINLTIPVGTGLSSLTLSVFHEVWSVGSLHLPTGLTTADVVVHLRSASANLTESGDAFTTGFFAPSGVYDVYASGTINNGSATPTTYASLGSITINATGVVTPAVGVTTLAAHVVGNLTYDFGGSPNGSVGVDLVGPDGISIPTTAALGFYQAVVPANATFTPLVNTTQLVTVGGVTQYETFTAATGTSCVATFPSATCNVPLVGVPLTETFAGAVTYAGFPAGLSGTIKLVGPLPATTVRTIAFADGAFSAALAPGTYQAYTAATGSFGALANLTLLTVSPTAPPALVIALGPTWTDTVTIAGPAGVATAAATLTVTTPTGVALTLAGVAIGSSVALALPVGVYTVSATAPGAPYGVPANATASASVVLAAGNAATRLALAFHLVPSVTITLVGPSTQTVGGGGVAEIAFVAHNVGTAPATVAFVGSPSTWNFTLAPANATLGVGGANATVAGTARVVVPAGTLATPPPATLQAVYLTNSTAAGPPVTWIIRTTAYVGLTVGASRTGILAAPQAGTIAFYLLNGGNVPESVTVGIENALDLAALGWSTTVYQGNAPLVGATSVAPGSNTTFSVKLAAASSYALHPNEVDLAVTASNGSMAISRPLVLAVPLLTVALNGTVIAVTGPNVGAPSPYPDWLIPVLAFVPAIALVVGLVTYRWWRTRRWVRR